MPALVFSKRYTKVGPYLLHRSRFVTADTFCTINLATIEELDRVIGVNQRGIFLCYKHALIEMMKRGRGGVIVGASSVFGKKGKSPSWKVKMI